MSIAILPARLANQIAAGEVVERPASVIKELVENSLDAGATSIQIDVVKGGIKKIKITDNGHGIVKDELTLALSRHATSKIKDLNDLEAINSLGFRGEALASISSVARLTLTSKPENQNTAWQAVAEGRDMSVNIKPAAHPNGTTIEVSDLFFNTPARRKFLRTEKTEFNHIDEVIKRIALAHFEVSFQLNHNGKTVRQYRMAATQAQASKRVAMVCSPKFIENAIEVSCPHDNMALTGWLAKPSFSRSQNDLCYSYVNGRMMRDKLINHAIRQAYDNLLPADSYPAFVLFLQLDYREVDVNVHPAKHEVRFHQSRYVHDFIYSVCHKALLSSMEGSDLLDNEVAHQAEPITSHHANEPVQLRQAVSPSSPQPHSVAYPSVDYITPIQHISDVKASSHGQATNNNYARSHVSSTAVDNYQTLMTPHAAVAETNFADEQGKNSPSIDHSGSEIEIDIVEHAATSILSLEKPGYALYQAENEVRVLSLFSLAQTTNQQFVAQSWSNPNNTAMSEGLISQPLLLPVAINLTVEQVVLVGQIENQLATAGIVIKIAAKDKIQIREFPALLRERDVKRSFELIIQTIQEVTENQSVVELSIAECSMAIAKAMQLDEYDFAQAKHLLTLAKKVFTTKYQQQLHLNSVSLDLTSHIKLLS